MQIERILVLEDEGHFGKLAGDFAAMKFRRRSEVAEARATLAATSFDLVLSDVHCPGTGLELLREQHAREEGCFHHDVGSGHANHGEAVRFGAVDYLIKPFQPDNSKVVLKA